MTQVYGLSLDWSDVQSRCSPGANSGLGKAQLHGWPILIVRVRWIIFFFFNSEKSNTNLLEKKLITDSIIKNLFSKIICHAENDNKNHCSEDDVHVLDWEELVMYRELLITHVTTVLLNVFNDTKKAQTLQILMVTVCYFCTVTRLWVGDWYCSRLLDSWQLQKRTNHTEERVSLQESSKRPASFKAFTLCWGLWVTCTSEKLLLRKPIQLFESPPN